MDREQKIRFLKEIVSSSRDLENHGDSDFMKLKKSLEKGFTSKNNGENTNLDLSDEEFDEVISQSPWVVDAVFQMIEGYNSDEEVDFGQENNFKMKNLYLGIQDLMDKYKEYEDEQKL